MDSPYGRSARLYNEDLAPRATQGHWRTWDLFCWWMSAWHSLGGYTFAIGLLVLGLTGWQMVVAMFIGILILYWGCNRIGIAGQQLGVPFPVFARVSFGVFGANIPALLRAFVAVAWYGIQTYLASVAIMTLVLKFWPASVALTHSGFLGLSALGWICFLALWAAQLVVLHRGMETVRKLSDLAGPVLWLAMIALAVWVLYRAHWSVDWNYHEKAALGIGGSISAIASGAFLTVAYLAGPMLNFADFSRFSPSKRSVVAGNRLGLPLNGTAFCVIAVVIALASTKVYGKAVRDPVELVKDIDNVALLLVATVAIAGATVGINIVLNFVSPAYDFANAVPSKVTFKRGGVITALLALVIMPWKIYSSPIAVNLFIGGVGALMGPLFGIMLADFYLIRKSRVDVAKLYTADRSGPYFYRGGVSVNAVIALVISGALTLVMTFAPALATIAPYSWAAGAACGALACLAVNRIRPDSSNRAAPPAYPDSAELAAAESPLTDGNPS